MIPIHRTFYKPNIFRLVVIVLFLSSCRCRESPEEHSAVPMLIKTPETTAEKKRNSRPQQPFWTRRLNVGLICWGCNKLLYCVGVCSVEPWRTWKAQSKTRFFLFSFPGESPGIFSGLSDKEHWTGDCVFESTSWIRFSGNLKKVKQS